MAVQKLGLRDLPIEHSVDETLGLAPYASVLTEFVERCDTPITIALQGDWGSGKTSLMNLIKESLDNKGTYQTVWFNTWQYAQFNMSDTLALSMMTYFIDCLSPKGGAAATAAKSLLNVARAVAVGGASVIGHGDTIKTVLTEAQEGAGSTADPSRALTNLKNQLTEIVKERVKSSNLHKVVVFIDDIDRLVPVKAIELLEALKIFLDIDQCVYVIACDYSVVVTGLKEKFHVSEIDLKGKSFFDKIIQVPFKMPINRYDVDRYLTRLLGEIDIPANEDDIEMYRDLIKCSVGFNPRTMKRLFNSLLLLTILAKDVLDLDSGNKKRESSRVLFGILCMQEHYESLYDYIRRQSISDEMFHSLIEGMASEASDDEFGELRKSMSGTDLAKAKEFLDTFFRCVQLQDDGNDQALSEAEGRHLKDVLGLSAIVSAGNDFQGLETSALVVSMRQELNWQYARYLNRKRVGRFRFSRPNGEVWLDLPPPLDRFRFSIWCEEGGRLSYGVNSIDNDEERLRRVNEHLKGELEIEGGNETYHEYWGWYTEWKVEKDGSRLDDFKACLYEVLDTLLPDLAGICSRAS